ncbi:MAG TPA: hypothetical protein VF649_13490 [Sphingomonas sp.]|uniref:hypothetical protein n=1 Tax=Sphingomonas sp. TaxID=28214 RepID=UPI002ED91CF1
MAAVAALALAAGAGLTLPDLDQHLPLLHHRSALTHGLLPALPALARRWLHPVAAGLALGLGFHLAADAFPAAMTGYATIKLPLYGSLGGWSYLWLAVNALAGGWLFGRLVETLFAPPMQGAVVIAALLLGLVYLYRVPGGWSALLAYAAIGWIGWRLHRPSARA